MNKNLVIHPSDCSTDFLQPCYQKLENTHLITGNKTFAEVKALCLSHQRILMMGHGFPHGLFSVGQFPGSYGTIIDSRMVELLEKKENNVFIWCDADQFVKSHNLKGFFTGMFISEVSEASHCGLGVVSESLVKESNEAFAAIVSKYINCASKELYDNVKNEYKRVADNNRVAAYNHSRLYYK